MDQADMRLRMHANSANEELVALINDGYEAITAAQVNYRKRKDAGIYDDAKHVDEVVAPVDEWAVKVVESLDRIFPTKLEIHLFLDPEIPLVGVRGDYQYEARMLRCRHFVRGLNKIRTHNLPEYTDLPLEARLYVEDIDSFRKVRDVNPATVMELLADGYLDWAEDKVQTAFERILSVPFHKKDWGGEQNDLYTANVVVNGARQETAFVLKGNGRRNKTMEIKHCGANGDQILRLCNSPAKLFVVQFVGRISEAVVADIDIKIRHSRSQGKDSWYCIMDGQDTARVLRAYGEL